MVNEGKEEGADEFSTFLVSPGTVLVWTLVCCSLKRFGLSIPRA